MRGTLDGGTVPVDHRLDRLAEMARQVPAICHPNGIGRALADAVGMGAGPIPGGDRDAGRLAQPGGQGLGLPVWRQIDALVTLEVDRNGAVAPAAPPGAGPG